MFEYEGVKYTLNDLEIEAKKQGVDVNDFIKQMEGAGMERVIELVPYDYKKETRTYGESWGNALGRTGLNLFSGATDYVDMSKRFMIDLYFDMQDENVDQNTRAAIIKNLEEKDGLMQAFGPGLKGVGEKDIFELGIDYFGLDERIEADQTITEDLKDLNFSRAGARIIESGLESAPSLIAAYIGAPAMIGYAAILAGDKFQEEYENNPDESIKKLYFNATASGGIEMGFEMVTRGLLKKAGILAKNGNAKAAREMLKGGSTSLIKNIGVGFTGEGLSEAATELTQTLFDALPSDMGGLGKEIPSFDKLKYILGDNFIVGGFIGGGISTFGEISKRGKDAEQKATLLLMEETEKNKIFDIGKEISKLQKDHSKANDAGKEIIENEISNKASDIQKIYDTTKLGLNNLSSSDLKTYSQNVSDINSLKQDIKENVDNNSIKDINGKKIKDLVDTNKKLLGEAITKGTELQETALQESIKFAKEKGETIGKKTIVVKDDTASQLEYNKLRKKYGESEKNVAGTDGFILGDTIVINETVARESGAIAVGSHELLHGVIGNSFGKLTTVERAKLGKSFMSVLTSKQEAAVRKRLKDGYNIEGDAVFQSEEMFTAFSDAIIKKEISFNENIFSKIGNSIQETLRKLSESGYIGKESFLYRKEFSNGRQVYNFLKDYTKNVQKNKLSKRAQDFAKVDPETVEVKKSVTAKKTTGKVNELGEMGWTNKSWKEQGADFAIKEMQDNKMLDGLILAQPHVGVDNDTFLQTTYAELLPHVRNYKPENENPNGLFGWINPQIGNKAKQAYNSITKEEIKGTKDIGETTKEGEVKIQVAADTDAATEAFETEDLSITGQAQKKADEAKTEKQKESEFRKNIGIETGSKIYNDILDGARKSLLRAYEAGTSVRNIQRKLRNEANVYLFKTVKNFLGNKEYISNLKKFRKPIMKVMFTADLVQLERNVPEDQRVFTKFVKKLTSKQEVQAAVDQNLLPASALNIIDKGTAVNLYEKANISESNFISFFDIPAINPVTGQRSGKRGTRKDQIAKYITGALTYDATMEVAQEPEVIQRRAETAELNNTEILKDDLQVLAAAINRDSSIKFSITSKQKSVKIVAGKVIIDLDGAQKVLDDIFNDNSKIDFYRNLTEQQAEKYGGKFIVEAVIDNYDNRGFERLDNKVIKDFILKNKKKKQKVSTVYEQFFINLARKAISATSAKIKSNLVVREGGIPDVHFEYNGKSIGLEIKMDSARGVSYTWKFNDTSTNPNPVDQAKQNKLISTIKEISNNKIFENIDFNKGVTQDQLLNLKTNKHLFNQSEKVDASYLEYHYTNKSIPEYFINVGDAGVFYMLSGDNVIDAEILNVANKLGIPRLSGTFDLISRMNIGSVRKDGTRATTIRIEPRIDSKSKENFPNKSDVNLSKQTDMNNFVKEVNNSLVKHSRSSNGMTFDNALKFSRSTNNKTQGITVLDFDDTLATTKSLVKFTKPDGTTGTLNAEQYANTYESLLEQGYTFDFSEFNKVVKGKIAPLFQKALKLQGKFGPENMFVLTARPAAAQKAIFDFLKANGLNIPIDNITGLGNSTADAKALWVANKVGEGYNDFYFADDALQNVKAVKNMLDQFDVKSKVQQARVKFSKNMSNDFNKIIEKTTGTPAEDIISAARAAKRGAKKGKYKFFLPPSAEDFRGLLYYFMGKGRQGDKDAAFLKKALTDPLNKAYNEFNAAKQVIANDYSKLRKLMPDQMKKVLKQTPDGDFTYGDAVRVYLWNKAGFDVPGLTEQDVNNLVNLVTSDSKLQEFAERVGIMSRTEEGYVKPGEYWQVGDIRNDLDDATNKVGRKQFFTEFVENTENIFGKMVNGKLTGDNINKIEAIYGSNFREALEDILYRTINGTSRTYGSNRMVNEFTNWVNGSVGAVMFVNMRSALLQQMSTVNFINYGDNNIFKAAARLADQKQFWKDWTMIFNSDKLKQRRSGLSMDINANELTTYLNKSKSKTKAAINYLLRQGFKPTQISDSVAIANGGATFYRNRVNTYLEQGLSKKEAEAKAFNDFSEIAEETQQSARPDMVSQQQASSIGKWFLNFLNTPMQYSRIIKKSALDLINRRRKDGMNQLQSDTTNVSRMLYYGFAQNVIFYTLQTGLFAAMFDDEDDEDSKKFFDKKYQMAANSIVDGLLRGLGFGGAAISTLKNMIVKFVEEDKKGYTGKPVEKVALEMVNLSPVVGIKVRRIANEVRSYSYNKDVIKHMETFDIDNPMWGVTTGVVEGLTNIPVNRLYRKTMNLRAATDADREAWERLALLSGWSVWNIGKQNDELQTIKDQLKSERKILNKQKNKKKSKIQYNPAFR